MRTLFANMLGALVVCRGAGVGVDDPPLNSFRTIVIIELLLCTLQAIPAM